MNTEQQLAKAKKELKDLHRELEAKEKEAIDAEKLLKYLNTRLQELRGSVFGRGNGEIPVKEQEIKDLERRLKDESLPKAVWIDQDGEIDEDHNPSVVFKVTEKRIYLRCIEDGREYQMNKDGTQLGRQYSWMNRLDVSKIPQEMFGKKK